MSKGFGAAEFVLIIMATVSVAAACEASMTEAQVDTELTKMGYTDV